MQEKVQTELRAKRYKLGLLGGRLLVVLGVLLIAGGSAAEADGQVDFGIVTLIGGAILGSWAHWGIWWHHS